MFYAISEQGGKVGAEPGGQGRCPGCRSALIPKCGDIKAWHWAHRADDCDPWYEPETLWHLEWKGLVAPEKCEVVMENHRADIVGRNGLVIELQHSSLTPYEARERERFYMPRGLFIWVFDATPFRENVQLRVPPDRQFNEGPNGELRESGYRTFRWKRPRPTHALLKAHLWWDLGGGTMFQVKKIYPEVPCGGWGYICGRKRFIERFIGGA